MIENDHIHTYELSMKKNGKNEMKISIISQKWVKNHSIISA